jgi:hypothetical protein
MGIGEIGSSAYDGVQIGVENAMDIAQLAKTAAELDICLANFATDLKVLRLGLSAKQWIPINRSHS